MASRGGGMGGDATGVWGGSRSRGESGNRGRNATGTWAGNGSDDLAGAIDEVAALARAGVEASRVWEPILGSPGPRIEAGRDAGGAGEARSATDLYAALARVGMPDGLRRRLAGIEQVAQTTGASRADLLAVLSACLADREAAADAQAVALAGPRATAKVLAWLPALGLALGTAMGADPIPTILRGGIAGIAAVVGLVLMVAGWAWTRALLAAAQGDDDGAIVSANILAAVLDAGLALPAALSAMDRFGEGQIESHLAAVGDRLTRGQPWDRAWEGSPIPGHVAPGNRHRPSPMPWRRRRAPDRDAEFVEACRRALTLAWHRGVSATPLLTSLAQRWRRRIQRDSAVAAARLGVHLMLPLGLCYLPAFMALGLVPVIVSLASGLSATL